MQTRYQDNRSKAGVIASKVRCGDRGSWYSPKTWHANSTYAKHVWRCNAEYINEKKCTGATFTSLQLEEIFVLALEGLLEQMNISGSIFSKALAELLETASDEKVL